MDKRQSYGDNEKKNAAADPGKGPRGAVPPPLPLCLDQTEARRAEKFFLSPGPSLLGDRSPPPAPPLSEGLDPLLNMCALRKPLFVIEITEEASYNKKGRFNLPGHGFELHSLLSPSFPGHVFPPALGGGCVQLLDRSCEPIPQDLLHELQTLQTDQPPSTVKRQKNRHSISFHVDFNIKGKVQVIT